MSERKQQSSQEDEVFEFLNSLPEQQAGTGEKTAKITKDSVDKPEGKTDQEILNFLDELEASNNGKTPPGMTAEPVAEPTAKLEKETVEVKQEVNDDVKRNVPVGDPITSISNWWSGSGSAAVTSQISSLWGTAQSIGEEAHKRADSALKKAREQGIEENLKHAFKEFGISAVLEGDRELTADEKEQLLKLPDARKALGSLNKGISLFSTRVTNVLESLNSKDEVMDIKLVHDLKNYPNLADFVKHNFEDVMNAQVEGNIDVHVEQSGTKVGQPFDETEQRDMGLFQGKLSDADRLVQANIESIMKVGKEGKKEEERGNSSGPELKSRLTNIFIGLLAVSVSKEGTTDSTGANTDSEKVEDGTSIVVDEYQPSSFCFTATLVDKVHDINIVSRSQPFPLKWCKWLDGNFEDIEHTSEDVDPSAWVVDWIEQGLDQMFGVLAQTYLIMRMGY
ncbi:DEKNAAC101324 [Brettanomyces naardenensis]|uniref:DEKNAAC101324 n=1 Tax=Brettanomyces naardenensis TaxID=13370 RepID=A0A448YHI7_BRENA|nr:DEKNAAC101324 [Brettanomyces naardenensis]